MLVHYRDAEAANPTAWRWEDRVWRFERDGGRLVWTEYDLVVFRDAEGRFEALRTPWARRIEGAWEPNARQRLQIERGLHVNPRGARALVLERNGGGGWRSVVDERAVRSGGVDFDLRGAVRWHDGWPVFRVEERIVSAERAEMLSSVRYVAESEGEDAWLRGRYDRDGVRIGRFRMLPTDIRLRTQHRARGSGRVLEMRPDPTASWKNVFPALLRPWHYFAPRHVEIETTPPGALLSLYYLRRGSQRIYETARAPLRVELPNRFIVEDADGLVVKAHLPATEISDRG